MTQDFLLIWFMNKDIRFNPNNMATKSQFLIKKFNQTTDKLVI